MAAVLVMPNYRLVFKTVSQTWTASSTCQLPPVCNFGTQLETDASHECFSTKWQPLIFEDLIKYVKLLTGNGQGEADE